MNFDLRMLESLFLMIANCRCCVAVKLSKMANNFKVDTLVKTFKDLQQEKSCLEQKLRELREQRKRIDSENETAFARLTQVGSRIESGLQISDTVDVLSDFSIAFHLNKKMPTVMSRDFTYLLIQFVSIPK